MVSLIIPMEPPISKHVLDPTNFFDSFIRKILLCQCGTIQGEVKSARNTEKLTKFNLRQKTIHTKQGKKLIKVEHPNHGNNNMGHTSLSDGQQAC